MSVKKYLNLAQKKLFRLNRSITGYGLRRTLYYIKKEFPNLKIKSLKSNTRVFDWKIPYEWNLKDAYILDKNKKKIIDFKKNNLHIVGYSSSCKKILKKKEILKKIHSLPKSPNAIPYITSYYKNYWGFCETDKNKKKIIRKYKKEDKFKIFIDSSFNNKGRLNYGEIFLKSSSKQEILISTYICHPSMANNELSGPIVSMSLIKYFLKKKLKKSLRFIFIPETIGSISFLNKSLKKLKKNLIGGYNLTCIGDEKNHSCIFSKYNNSIADKSLKEAYKKLNIKFKKYSFLERGSDERQYNSPGIDLPIATICRTRFGKFKEYHTSLDNFELVTEKGLTGGFKVAKKAIEILQNKVIPRNKILCEPQLSKRNMYPTLSTRDPKNNLTKKTMDFLQYADGKNDLDDISKIIKVDKKLSYKIYAKLKKVKIID